MSDLDAGGVAEVAIAVLKAEVRQLKTMLADCYRATGEDPDGNEDWRLAEHAVSAVLRLRNEADELGEALDRWRSQA